MAGSGSDHTVRQRWRETLIGDVDVVLRCAHGWTTVLHAAPYGDPGEFRRLVDHKIETHQKQRCPALSPSP